MLVHPLTVKTLIDDGQRQAKGTVGIVLKYMLRKSAEYSQQILTGNLGPFPCYNPRTLATPRIGPRQSSQSESRSPSDEPVAVVLDLVGPARAGRHAARVGRRGSIKPEGEGERAGIQNQGIAPGRRKGESNGNLTPSSGLSYRRDGVCVQSHPAGRSRSVYRLPPAASGPRCHDSF